MITYETQTITEVPELKIRREENGDSFLYLKRKQDWFEERMLFENKPEGILQVAERKEEFLRYEIQGQKSLSVAFERVPMNLRQIFLILKQIFTTMETTRELLLSENSFILLPDFIFLSFPDYSISLTYYPGYQVSFSEQMGRLFEMLLNRVDYREEKAISVVYELYMLLQEPDIGLKKLHERLLQLCEPVLEQSMTPDASPLDSVVFESKRIEQRKSELFSEPKRIERRRQDELISDSLQADRKNLEQKKNGQRKRISFFGGSKKGLFSFPKETFEKEPLCLAEQEMEYGTRKTRVLKVNRISSEPSLISERSGEEIRIDRFPFFVGSLKGYAGFVIPEDTVSRFHAKLSKKENHFYLTDLNSTNGTRLNGRLLEVGEDTCLTSGDRIRFADEEYCFFDGAGQKA